MRKFVISLGIITALLAVLLISQATPDLPVDQLTDKYANGASKFLEIDGILVHYRDEGQGHPLLLLHGSGSSLHTWDGWVHELSSEFRLIRLDLPGFGLTGPRPDNDYSPQRYVSLLTSLLNHLNLDTCAIAGNSFGGEIAWVYALTHPHRINKLILIDAAGYPLESFPTAFQLARIPVLNRALTFITPRSLVAKSLLQVYYDDNKVTEELIERHYDLTRRAGNRDALIARAQSLHENRAQQIESIQTPTLILWGEQDLWTPVEHGRRFHRDLLNSRLIIYDEAGHVPMEELPEKTARDAREFLLGQEES